MTRLGLLLVSLLVGACSYGLDEGPRRRVEEKVRGDEAALATRGFVDARSYFTRAEDIDAWFALTAALKSDFDGICGDTFCEGDFSNYESLAFRCSVHARRGTIGSCAWVFAASLDEVEPATGAIRVDARTWTCAAPLAPATRVRDFVNALSAPGSTALFAPLPGTQRSLYDGLAECL